MALGRKTGGRKKGTTNKLTGELKEMILTAAELAGGEGGTVSYLRGQALANPQAFMSLLGRVLPMTVNAQVKAEVRTIRNTIVDPRGDD